MTFLSACERVGSDRVGVTCPPVVEYSLEEQMGVAEELMLLPDSSKVVEWLADYLVLREQCRGRFR